MHQSQSSLYSAMLLTNYDGVSNSVELFFPILSSQTSQKLINYRQSLNSRGRFGGLPPKTETNDMLIT